MRGLPQPVGLRHGAQGPRPWCAAWPPLRSTQLRSRRLGRRCSPAACMRQAGPVTAGRPCLAPPADIEAIRQRLSQVKHKVLVLSGKGGVGKSTFSSQLAFALAAQGKEVGGWAVGWGSQAPAWAPRALACWERAGLERLCKDAAARAAAAQLPLPLAAAPPAGRARAHLAPPVPCPRQVGLLDIDICGPSIPKMLGLEGEEIHQSAAGWSPV
jgi:Mrp family chromosome partitioning ATPase